MATLRRNAKSAAAFRTISEVSQHLEVPQHVLRFWETKFSQVRPLKRGGGRRYYRPEDVQLLQHIRDLLYADGYTIKGVQRLLKEGGPRPSETAALAARIEGTDGHTPANKGQGSAAGATGLSASDRRELEGLRRELTELRDLLRSATKEAGEAS